MANEKEPIRQRTVEEIEESLRWLPGCKLFEIAWSGKPSSEIKKQFAEVEARLKEELAQTKQREAENQK